MKFKSAFTRIFIVIISLVSFQQISYATENDSTVNRIFTLIYNQQFSAAEKLLQEQTDNLDPFYNNVLKLDLFWWKYSLSRSREDAKKFTEILDLLTKASVNTREEKINELVILSYKMRYEIKRYNVIGAFILRSDARKRIDALKMTDLSFLGEHQKLFDFYLTLFAYFDEVLNPFPFGNKSGEYSKSLQALEKYSLNADLILSTMAHYYLGRIYTKVEKQSEKGKAHFRILAQRFHENSLFAELANGLNPEF